MDCFLTYFLQWPGLPPGRLGHLLRIDLDDVLLLELLQLLGHLGLDGSVAVMSLLDVDVAGGLAPELNQADGAAEGRPVKVAVHVLGDGVADLEELVANAALVVGGAVVLLGPMTLEFGFAVVKENDFFLVNSKSLIQYLRQTLPKYTLEQRQD